MKQKYHQTGIRKSLQADHARSALLPGWRVSKNGNLYYEARRNRSDMPKSKL